MRGATWRIGHAVQSTPRAAARRTRRMVDSAATPRGAGRTCATSTAPTPQLKAKARQRIEAAADRMSCEVLGVATTGQSGAARLAAITPVRGLSAGNCSSQVLEPSEDL
jgi:hypothetical protein